MSSNSPRDPWPRLAAAARQITDDRETTAPYGFATRVVALAMSSERRVASLFERFAFKAVGVACLLAIASVAINYSALTRPASNEEPMTAADDPMSVLLDA
jgi:hypothetical protein